MKRGTEAFEAVLALAVVVGAIVAQFYFFN